MKLDTDKAQAISPNIEQERREFSEYFKRGPAAAYMGWVEINKRFRDPAVQENFETWLAAKRAARIAGLSLEPVAMRDALRWSKANQDYHGYIAFTPEQLKLFVSHIQISPAAPLSDAKDAERYRWLRNESWAGYNVSKSKPQVFETVTMVIDGARNFKTILAEDALDNAIDAAIATAKEAS